MTLTAVQQAWLLSAGLLVATAAQAARPLVTDDTGVIAPADCELEAGSSRSRDSGQSARTHGLQLACGVGAGTQLALALSRQHALGQREREAALLAKTLLVDADDASWGLAASLGWQGSPQASLRRATSSVSLLHTRGLGGAFTLHANLGHQQQHLDHQRSTSWGLALEHVGWGPVALMGEAYGDDRSAPWWGMGARWSVLPDRLSLDLAWGRQVTGGRPSLGSVGLKLSF